jgi:hypothetical protein
MTVKPDQFNNDIVNVYFQYSSQQIMKNQVHGMLVCHTGVFEPEGHHHPFKQSNTTWAMESHFANVFLGHENLIVPCVTIPTQSQHLGAAVKPIHKFGKTTAQEWRLPTQKESPNGGVNWRLADGERVVVPYLDMGNNCEKKGGSFGCHSLLSAEEREGMLAVPSVGVGALATCRSSWTTVQRWLPWHEAETVWATLLTGVAC